MVGKRQYREYNIAIGNSILDNIVPTPYFTGTSVSFEANMVENNNIGNIIIN